MQCRFLSLWVAIAAALALLGELVSEPLIRALPDPFDTAFDLQPVRAPILSGMPLSLFAAAVHLPVIGPMIIGYLMNDNGFSAVRDWAAAIDDEPIYTPYVPPTATQLKQCPPVIDEESIPRISGYGVGSKVSPTMEAARVLAAVESSSAQLGAFLSVDADGTLMAAAKASTARWMSGEAPAFEGVPVAIKDEVDVRGYPTFQGTSFLGIERQPNAPDDSLPVARLRAAGALIIGKTVMMEIGIGTTGHNVHHGTPRNPYPLGEYYPGGSSAGSAVAVASGLVPAAIAADGGGSVRIPAALCGIVGLKPTFGRVPCANDLDYSVGVIGPMGRDVNACAAMYMVIAGAESKLGARDRAPFQQHSAWPQPTPHLSGLGDDDLRGVRIGVWPAMMEAADPEISAASWAMLSHYEAQGAVLVNISLPSLFTLFKAHTITILSEFATAMDAQHAAHARDFALDTQVKLAMGRMLTARDLIAAQKVRARWIATLQVLFDDVDALASPATAIPAPPIEPTETIDLTTTEQLMRFSPLANLAGIPAITFPVGQLVDRRPLAMMLSARWWDEHVLLRLAHVAERLREPMAPPHRYYGSSVF